MKYQMGCKLSTLGSSEYILPVTLTISATPVSLCAPIAQSISIIPVSPYTCHSSIHSQAEWRWLFETYFPAMPVFGRYLFSWYEVSAVRPVSVQHYFLRVRPGIRSAPFVWCQFGAISWVIVAVLDWCLSSGVSSAQFPEYLSQC